MQDIKTPDKRKSKGKPSMTPNSEGKFKKHTPGHKGGDKSPFVNAPSGKKNVTPNSGGKFNKQTPQSNGKAPFKKGTPGPKGGNKKNATPDSEDKFKKQTPLKSPFNKAASDEENKNTPQAIGKIPNKKGSNKKQKQSPEDVVDENATTIPDSSGSTPKLNKKLKNLLPKTAADLNPENKPNTKRKQSLTQAANDGHAETGATPSKRAKLQKFSGTANLSAEAANEKSTSSKKSKDGPKKPRGDRLMLARIVQRDPTTLEFYSKIEEKFESLKKLNDSKALRTKTAKRNYRQYKRCLTILNEMKSGKVTVTGKKPKQPLVSVPKDDKKSPPGEEDVEMDEEDSENDDDEPKTIQAVKIKVGEEEDETDEEDSDDDDEEEEDSDDEDETSDDDASDEEVEDDENTSEGKITSDDVSEDKVEEDDLSDDTSSEDDNKNDISGSNVFKGLQQKINQTKSPQTPPNKGSEKYVVYVSNLPYDLDGDTLKEYFAKAGEVLSVRVPLNRETNKPRGFAFVEFANEESHQKSLSLDNTAINGRTISVVFAREGRTSEPRNQNSKPRFSGPRRGGGQFRGGFNKSPNKWTPRRN